MRDALERNPNVSRADLEALHSDVFGWALSRCDYDRTTAEDLVQQAYVELISGKARFDGRSSLKSFVFGIVQNLSLRRFRRLATRMRFVSRQDRAEPVEEFELADDHRGLWAAVGELPARQRDMVELVFCRELTIAEASTVMGVSLGTGRVHYERAKQRLRELLDIDND
ncbi:MAG: RNA polymerase sigma factor [Pseudomonadota bacterium]